MKRRPKAALKPRNIVLSITICGAICLAGVGYVWAKSQVYALGKEMKALEVQLEDLKHANARLQQNYATLCSPRELDAAVARLNLGLAAPRPDQIVRLVEPPREADREEKNYASNLLNGN